MERTGDPRPKQIQEGLLINDPPLSGIGLWDQIMGIWGKTLMKLDTDVPFLQKAQDLSKEAATRRENPFSSQVWTLLLWGH